jgi:hypothetical protein
MGLNEIKILINTAGVTLWGMFQVHTNTSIP